MKPRLVIMNQLDLPFFSAWLKKFAQTHTGVEYWNGDVSPEAMPGTTIRKSPRYNRDSTLGRFVAWLRYTGVCFWRLLWLPRKTPIFLTTTPPIAIIMLWVAHRLKKQPYVVLEWDIYPQIASVMGMFSRQNILYKLWYWLHGMALRRASAVITISDGMAEELRIMAKKDIPLMVIPNWADVDHFHPIPREQNTFAQAHNITDQLVVSYSGNMGETHAIETLLALADALVGHKDICFIFSGTGSKRKLIEDAVASGNHPNICLLGWLNDDDYRQMLACVDVSCVTLGQGYEKLSLPSKTYSALASGSAILGISDEPSDIATLLRTHGCGENFTPDDVQGMVRWITYLAENRDQLRAYQTASRQVSVTHYSETICTQKLNAVLAEYLIEAQI